MGSTDKVGAARHGVMPMACVSIWELSRAVALIGMLLCQALVENVSCIELVPCFVASLTLINVSELPGCPSMLDKLWYVVATVQEWIRA